MAPRADAALTAGYAGKLASLSAKLLDEASAFQLDAPLASENPGAKGLLLWFFGVAPLRIPPEDRLNFLNRKATDVTRFANQQIEF
jgi:hypothetical protein